MAGRLEGKVAVITGAGSGMGRAMAETFAREGAKGVVCADISGAEEDVARSLGDAGVAVQVDVTKSEDVRRMIATAEGRFGRLDVLCNNAGVSDPFIPLHEHEEDAFERMIAVNLRGVFLGMKYGIIAMLRTGGGAIVNTASAAGLVGWQGAACYSAAKGGVVLMTKTAALDYAQSNIRINAVCPGTTWTGLVPDAAGSREPPPGTPTLPNIPMDRWGLDKEIAAAALFLASDEASYVTGIAMPVDGGYVAM